MIPIYLPIISETGVLFSPKVRLDTVLSLLKWCQTKDQSGVNPPEEPRVIQHPPTSAAQVSSVWVLKC